MNFRLGMAAAFATVAGVALLFTFETPSVETVQRGYRGTGMLELYHTDTLVAQAAANKVPDPQPPQAKSGNKSSAVYANVKVLGDLDSDEFLRLMAAITEWVSPEQGCAYCHAEGEELSSDKLYTKVVSRRMLEMTMDVNAKWKNHVAGTGVTCFTCHRGNPVPANNWARDPGPAQPLGMAGNRAGQNMPSEKVALSSLPFDPFTPYLSGSNEIRVSGTTALPAGNRTTIQQTEWSYGLMMHMSEGLGVNCSYCHNTRAFGDWKQSTPQRVTAWHGIRMVREINNDYIDPLASVFPADRKGPLGDPLKVNCTTCHQGAFKPLYGASMVKDYPELAPSR